MAHDLGNQSVDALAKYDGAKQQLAAGTKQLKDLEATQFKIDLDAARGKKQLDATDEAVRTLSASVAKLAVEIPQIKADSQAKINNAAAVQNLDLRASATKIGLPDPGNTFLATAGPVASAVTGEVDNLTPWRYNFNKPSPTAPPPLRTQAAADFSAADHARDILQSGGRLADNEAEHIRHVAEVMSGHAVKSDQILETLKAILATQTSRDDAFSRDLRELKSQFDNRK